MDCLTDLRKLKEEIGKIKNNARLEIEEIKDTIKKAMEEFKIKKKKT